MKYLRWNWYLDEKWNGKKCINRKLTGSFRILTRQGRRTCTHLHHWIGQCWNRKAQSLIMQGWLPAEIYSSQRQENKPTKKSSKIQDLRQQDSLLRIVRESEREWGPRCTMWWKMWFNRGNSTIVVKQAKVETQVIRWYEVQNQEAGA